MKRILRSEIAEPIDLGAEAFPGHFGYRNRSGRSGLDYIDTQTEWARAQGLFLKALLTFKLRTKSLAALVAMGVGVVGLWLPFEFFAAEALAGVPPELAAYSYPFRAFDVLTQLECGGILLIFALSGLLLLINLILSLKDIIAARRG